MQQLAEERCRTAGVHAALRKKKAAIAERIQELRDAPIGVHQVFRYENDQGHGENAPEGSCDSDLGREKAHSKQRDRDTVLKDVLNESGSVQGVQIMFRTVLLECCNFCMCITRQRADKVCAVRAFMRCSSDCRSLPLHAKQPAMKSNCFFQVQGRYGVLCRPARKRCSSS